MIIFSRFIFIKLVCPYEFKNFIIFVLISSNSRITKYCKFLSKDRELELRIIFYPGSTYP